jgi:hypothetical protein
MRKDISAMDEETLAVRLQEIGFACTRCGECCRAGPGDNNLVMVSPVEIQQISTHYDLRQEEIAEPYPEHVELPGGIVVTLGWVLQRTCGDCRFYREGACQVYAARPWICRTYPFMLDGNELLTSPCRGIGEVITKEDALVLARDLLLRRDAEQEEEEKIRQALSRSLPGGERRLIVDSEGVKMV